jgi:hypothetical protein
MSNLCKNDQECRYCSGFRTAKLRHLSAASYVLSTKRVYVVELNNGSGKYGVRCRALDGVKPSVAKDFAGTVYAASVIADYLTGLDLKEEEYGYYADHEELSQQEISSMIDDYEDKFRELISKANS